MSRIVSAVPPLPALSETYLWLRRTWRFTRFAIAEYLRSGRIVVELATIAVAEWLLFWPHGASGFDPPQFFSLGGLVALGIAAYTSGTVMALGNRPSGYLLITRRLGRSGYFAGLYLAALLIASAAYVGLLATALAVFLAFRQSLNATPGLLLRGSLPLLLDVAVIVSLISLLAPLAIGRRLRLAVLAALAVALASDVGEVRTLDPTGALALINGAVHLAIAPATSGFALAVTQALSWAAAGTLTGQVLLAAVPLALALFCFTHRDLVLGS